MNLITNMSGRNRHRGMAMIWMIIVCVVIMGFVSFGVDLGRVQLAKMELQCVADAAARAAAAGLATSASQARAAAIAVAAANRVDGSPVVLTNSDIDVGNWASGVFTVNGLPSNAICVRAGRTAANGNAIPLLFAQITGQQTCDVRASAVATTASVPTAGFVGLSSITAKNNAFIASYNSGSVTTPTHSNHLNTGYLGSNGPIYGKNNNDIYGTALLGPSGSLTGFSVTGSTTTQATAITTTASPTWSPGTNPGGVAQSYTVNSNQTLAGGTYWFTSLSINAKLQFSGPTTVYVNGDVDLNGELYPTSKIPSDLTIYQIGNRSFGDSGANNMKIYAVIHAPDSDFTAKNNVDFYGSAVFDTITTKNNADFYYDVSSSSSGGAGSAPISLTR